MEAFILSVLASIIGGVLIIFGVSIVSQRARWVLTGLLARLVGMDIDSVFPNKSKVASDLKNELKRSRKIAILTGRGNELQRDTFSPLFLERPQTSQAEVRILLPDTEPKPDSPDWTAQRESEMALFDPAFGKGLLPKQIETTVQFLQGHVNANRVALRRFNMPHLGRIILTDRFVYFTPYQSNAHSTYCKVYKFRRGGEMYENLQRLFNQLWHASADSNPET